MEHGYLASAMVTRGGCGTAANPWNITALPGQRIELTLLDFSSIPFSRQQTIGYGGRSGMMCVDTAVPPLAKVNDSGTTQNLRACSEDNRPMPSFTSLANEIVVYLSPSGIRGDDDQAPQFLVEFQGKLYDPGCLSGL